MPTPFGVGKLDNLFDSHTMPPLCLEQTLYECSPHRRRTSPLLPLYNAPESQQRDADYRLWLNLFWVLLLFRRGKSFYR